MQCDATCYTSSCLPRGTTDVHILKSACASGASSDCMDDTFVCMCKYSQAVSKELLKDLLSMLLRNQSIYLSVIYPSIMPAAYLLLCELPLDIQQNAASVLSVFCQP